MGTGVRAQDAKYFSGITATSDYVSNGVSQTNGKAALQAYLEAESNGFYGGVWASSVDFGTGDNVEIDLYLGYRTLFSSGLFLDVGYARYYYDDTGDCCGEARITLAYDVLQKLGLKAYLAYNPETSNLNRRLSAAYVINDSLAVAGRYGKSDGNQNEYWDAGVTYTFTPNVAVDARYYGATTGDEGLVVSLVLSTSDVTFGRMFTEPFR